MSMMPRFFNTMRLTQAVYETAASILVTVSTVKSFPALMTLPFVDQVIHKTKQNVIFIRSSTYTLFNFQVWITSRGLARTVYFNGCSIFFWDRYLFTTRRTQVSLWIARYRRTDRAVQRHVGRCQASTSRPDRAVSLEWNNIAQTR